MPIYGHVFFLFAAVAHIYVANSKSYTHLFLMHYLSTKLSIYRQVMTRAPNKNRAITLFHKQM